MKENNVDDLLVWCSKTKRKYLPIEDLDRFSGRTRILSDLWREGVIRRKRSLGQMMHLPCTILSGERFGRILWLSRKSRIADSDPEVVEAVPEFCLELDAARELIRMHEFRAGKVAGGEDNGAVALLLEGGAK